MPPGCHEDAARPFHPMALAALLRHLAFAACLAVLSACVVRLMIAARVMDTPDDRKAHAKPTPKGGGVGIVTAFLVGVYVLYRYAQFARLEDLPFRGVILASAAIAVVAFLDDLRDWPFFIKLGAQVAAAVTAVASGLFITVFRVPYLGPVDVGWAGAVLTLGWVLFATNAMNFIDGMNGLAGGVTLIAAGFLCGIAAHEGQWFVYFAALLLAAGVAGFLPFNYPRARIFMGDVGSQFCGFVLAVLGIAAARFERVDLSFLIVPMLLNGVLYDVAFTLVRRALAGARITTPHRTHLYQLAQRTGTPAPAVAALHWLFAVIGGVCCIGFIAAPSPLKPYIPIICLVPQLGWTAYVLVRVRRTGLAI
jgi:UDP-GlcNAc:undecaprenyl-phosphate/decaprenyl-phosphate GlcNAc-1-phosphate transferase